MPTDPTQPRTNRLDLNAALRAFAILTLPSAAILAENVTTAGPVAFDPGLNPLVNTIVDVVRGRTFHTVAVSTASGTTMDATVQIEGALEGDEPNWLPLTGTGITTPGIYTFRAGVNYLRVNVTAYTSGSITVKLQSQLGG